MSSVPKSVPAGALDYLRGQLAILDSWLDQILAQVELSHGDAERARGQGPRQQQVVDIDGSAMQQAMQEQIDAMLSELAGKAGQAAHRGEESIKHAEVAARQRLEAAARGAARSWWPLSRSTISARKHQAPLAELTTWGLNHAKYQHGQNRDRLLAGWHGMDEAVAKRPATVLSQLDQYAATLQNPGPGAAEGA